MTVSPPANAARQREDRQGGDDLEGKIHRVDPKFAS